MPWNWDLLPLGAGRLLPRPVGSSNGQQLEPRGFGTGTPMPAGRCPCPPATSGAFLRPAAWRGEALLAPSDVLSTLSTCRKLTVLLSGLPTRSCACGQVHRTRLREENVFSEAALRPQEGEKAERFSTKRTCAAARGAWRAGGREKRQGGRKAPDSRGFLCLLSVHPRRSLDGPQNETHFRVQSSFRQALRHGS